VTKQLGFTIGPPPVPEVTDIVSQRLLVNINDASQTAHDAAIGGAAPWPEIVVNPGDRVRLTVVNVNAAGTLSAPGPALEFTAVDDMPPPAPDAPLLLSRRDVFGDAAPRHGDSSSSTG
jgi:FtsP/CotA-like multicopper oxidase with cupredoxin domain